jgi:hypothetical protein
MTDVAVSEKGELWAVSPSAVHRIEIQGSNVHCAASTPLGGAVKGAVNYALSFAPAGVLDPQKEVLIAGNTAGELWAIDEAGTGTQHGHFGNVPANDGHGHTYANAGKRWELSGDIVFLANGKTPVGFATVRDCPNPPSTSNCDTVDTLIQIDLVKLASATTGSVTKSVRGKLVPAANCPSGGKNGFGSMYGVAALGAQIYGFSHDGSVVSIHNQDGSACLLQSSAANNWYGAGVTTLAPVVVPAPT